MVFSGKYKTGEQILRLVNERFAVPETLFHPSDIGIQEMGIPEAIVDSVQSLPEGPFLRMKPAALGNSVTAYVCPQRCSLTCTRTLFWLEETCCSRASESVWRRSYGHLSPPTSQYQCFYLQSKSPGLQTVSSWYCKYLIQVDLEKWSDIIGFLRIFSRVLPFFSPVCYAWEGGKLLAHSPDFDEMVVTREEYEENGHCVCEDKFDIWGNDTQMQCRTVFPVHMNPLNGERVRKGVFFEQLHVPAGPVERLWRCKGSVLNHS